MYSIILMAAMTTGGQEAPAFHHKRAACYGCYGCSGCYGCYGCYGGCYGCHGYVRSYGCWSSCHGCYGGCYGCYGGGCYGYTATCHGCVGYSAGCHGLPAGCYGGSVSVMPTGVVVPPTHTSHYGPEGIITYPPVYAEPKPTEKKPEPKADDEEASAGAPAQIVLDVPEGAKLYIDGKLMTEKTGPRKFHTPTLERGQAYFYDVKVVMDKDGTPTEDTKRLVVRAGQTTRETFDIVPGSDDRGFASID